MNKDRFSERIRRKLESIRPDFKEKDWARMQATLRQAIPPPSGVPPAYQPFTVSRWSARPWMLAAAAVSFVVLVSVAAWQRAQIADLRQTVSQLSKPRITTQPRQTPAETTTPTTVLLPPDEQTARRGEPTAYPPNQSTKRSADPATVSRPDTVYITRYVAVPAAPASPAPGRTGQRLADVPNASVDRIDRPRSVADAQPQRKATRSPTFNQTENIANNSSPVANGTTNAGSNATGNRPGSVNPQPRHTDEKRAAQPGNVPKSNVVNVPGSKKRPPYTEVAHNPASGERSTTAVPAGLADAGVSGETGQPTVMDALTTRPVTIGVPDWNEALTRQSRRMRPVRTTTVGGRAAPVSQPTSQPIRVAVGFRVGAGGEVSRTVRSGGVLTELLIGKHLTLGVGLGMASFAGGTFLTPEKFDERREKREKGPKPGGFRRDYVSGSGRGINPLSDILNIKTHTERVQIPISFGYRIPVSPTLSVLPSVGTTLGTRSKEYVTFTYREPFGGYEAASLQYDRSDTDKLLNNVTFGAGVEWKRNHWVVQAGPVVTVPLVADANWQESASLGLRARLFYQF